MFICMLLWDIGSPGVAVEFKADNSSDAGVVGGSGCPSAWLIAMIPCCINATKS